jgi:hypothetical protein
MYKENTRLRKEIEDAQNDRYLENLIKEARNVIIILYC